MPSDYSVRPYHPGDEEGIVELLELVFDGWPHFDLECTPLDHWKWKYLDNPTTNAVLSVAVSNNEIVGCFGLFIQRIKIGDRIFLGSNGVDVAVHPDFRRLGIYNKLWSLINELKINTGIKFHYGVEGNPILIRKNLRLGFYLFPFSAMQFIKIRDIDLHFRLVPTKYAYFKKYGFQLLKLYNKFKTSLTGSPSLADDFNIYEIKSFDDRIKVFWDEIKDHYNFIIERNKNYLNWRYCDSRGGKYIVKIAENNGRILGYSVIRINKYKTEYPTGYIVDIITLPDRFDVVNKLVKNAVQYFDGNNINLIQTLVIKHHPYEEVFRTHGFLNIKSKLYLNYPPDVKIDDDLNKFHKSSRDRIYFSYGDYDPI